MRGDPPIVIGGGPAGAAAAILLSRAGARPIIYERQAAVGDALCGGFLSWTTLARLEELGVSPAMLGGHRVESVLVGVGKRTWRRALPDRAMGVSRHRLDGLLLAQARALGAEIRHDTVRYRDDGFQTSNGVPLQAESIFLATGKHDMPGLPRSRGRGDGDPYLGLRARFAASPDLCAELAGTIEMHMFPGGYAGLVRQEDGQANLCMAVRKSRLAGADGSPARLLAQLADGDTLLARRIAAMPPAERMDAIGHVPYGWSARATRPGLFRLGDQAGVIPSLAGEGIGIALASARLATAAWERDGSAGSVAYQRAFGARLRPRLALAGLTSKIATRECLAPWFGVMATVPGLVGLLGRLTRI